MTHRTPPLIRQTNAGECGLACVAMICNFYGLKLGLPEFRRRFPVSSRGVNLKTLINLTDDLGFNSRPVKCELSHLASLSTPAILHWDLNHFVVLAAKRRTRNGHSFKILDPAAGEQWTDPAELSKHFTGIALELAPSDKFTKVSAEPRLTITQLWRDSSGLWSTGWRVVGLAILMQLFVLVSPLQLQLAIDNAMAAQDHDLNLALLLGFLCFWAINVGATFLRGQLILNITSAISLHTAVNLFRHTVFLPSTWFEKRHIGDVTSRFAALQPINDFLSKGIVSSAVDGTLGISTLALMLFYSPILALIALSAVTIYVALKLLSHSAARTLNLSCLTLQAREATNFLETIRGINTVKVFCQERNRQRLWHNIKSSFAYDKDRLDRFNSAFESVNASVVSLESLISVYASVLLVMNGTLSLGMILAFQILKRTFVGSSIRLTDQYLSFKLLDVHLDQLSDIVFAEPEPETKISERPQTLGAVELRDISYQYGQNEPLILHSINLTIRSGESIAIVGPSGAGKTTLIKILTCLLTPTSGDILIDGHPVAKYGVRRFRDQLGVVNQEETLFVGSIADNISFFDIDRDEAWLVQCCRTAQIHDAIIRMPMQYETPLGDIGSALSGGQKQRIFLARALYKRPSILVLDEAMSNLDIETELLVAQAVRDISIARIIVSHRPETIRGADRVFQVSKGLLEEVTSQIKSSHLLSATQ